MISKAQQWVLFFAKHACSVIGGMTMEKIIVCKNESEFNYYSRFLRDYCVDYTVSGRTIIASIGPNDYDEATGEWFPYFQDKAQQ